MTAEGQTIEVAVEVTGRTYSVPGTPFGIYEHAGDWIPVWHANGYTLAPLAMQWSNPVVLANALAVLWASLTGSQRLILTDAAFLQKPIPKADRPLFSEPLKVFLATADGGG